MWEPDGWAARARIGLLVPEADVGPESELNAMAPPGVSFHASRFEFPTTRVRRPGDQITVGPVEFVAAPGPLDAAIARLVDAPLDAFALAFTSTSYVADDAAVAARLGALVDGRPVVTTGDAILAALRLLGCRRPMLVDPPWFPQPLTDAGRAWLAGAGFDVADAAPADLPSGQLNVHPGGLYEWVRRRRPAGADAVVIGGNGFRAVGAVRLLERDLGVPVVTANSALLWRTLDLVGVRDPDLVRYGRLFEVRS